jgi:hypothetical protein
MTIADRQWRDSSPFRQSLETRAIALTDEYGNVHEIDRSSVLGRRLLCATVLAGAVILALPILIKAFPGSPPDPTPVTITISQPLQTQQHGVRLPKPQAPPPELLRGSLP